MSQGSDSYVGVTVRLMELRDASLRVENELTTSVWLPRAWVHFNDNLSLPRIEIGTEIKLRILGDKAEEKGLI